MGKIKEIYIELKREYKDFNEEDIPYLFQQYVNKHYPEVIIRNDNIYSIHRSDAIKMIEGFYRKPEIFINEQLAELLERHYASKDRQYIVVADHIELIGQCIKSVNEF